MQSYKVGIVAMSNGISQARKEKVDRLYDIMRGMGLEPVESPYIVAKDGVSSPAGTAKERAAALMEFYRDSDIQAIFDISGGDIANEVLPYLDYNVIGTSKKYFWGYSDLTTLINAIYTMTGDPSVLYQIRNMVKDHGEQQIADFKASFIDGESNLFDIDYVFLRGSHMEGVVVGGNIRCLLKLAGTPYFPDMNGKVLLLEANSGMATQMTAYLNQLKQMGVFKKINGIVLGTFSKMEEAECVPGIEELVLDIVPDNIPVAKTFDIGHKSDSKAIIIGREI